mgnify:CR=1 FL=1
MHAEIHTFPCENGEVLRVQLVRLPDWKSLDFLQPKTSAPVFPTTRGNITLTMRPRSRTTITI